MPSPHITDLLNSLVRDKNLQPGDRLPSAHKGVSSSILTLGGIEREYKNAKKSPSGVCGNHISCDGPWRPPVGDLSGQAGSGDFREAILERLEAPVRQEHGNSRRGISGSHNEQEAERLVAQGLKELGVDRRDLPKLAKGNSVKIAIACVVKQRTVVTNAWLAAELHMGAATRVSSYCAEQNMQADVKKLVEKVAMSI